MKLYVGNIPFSCEESDIRALFDDFGGVADLHIPLDRETGQPRGFVFVTLTSREHGESALAALEGSEMNGRPLRVSEAIERERPSGGGGGNRGNRGGGGGGGRGGYGDDGGGRSNWGDDAPRGGGRGGRGGKSRGHGGGRDRDRKRRDDYYG